LTLIILISIFFLGSFVRVLLVFKFIIRSKFMVYYFFQSGPYFLNFFYPYIKVIFLFNFTLQSKIYNCLLIFFYFNFYPPPFNCYLLFWILSCDFFSWFHFSAFDLLEIVLHGFSMYGAPSLMTRVMDLKS